MVHRWAYGLAQKFRVFTDLLGPSWLLRGWGKVELGLRTPELGQEVLVSAAVRVPSREAGEPCPTRCIYKPSATLRLQPTARVPGAHVECMFSTLFPESEPLRKTNEFKVLFSGKIKFNSVRSGSKCFDSKLTKDNAGIFDDTDGFPRGGGQSQGLPQTP